LAANSLGINLKRGHHSSFKHTLDVETCEERVCENFVDVSVAAKSAGLFFVQKFEDKVDKLIGVLDLVLALVREDNLGLSNLQKQ
jgi:hypothetical protein